MTNRSPASSSTEVRLVRTDPAEHLPRPPLGIPLLARLRNDSQVRDLDSYTAVEEALNRNLEALIRQTALKTLLMQTHAQALGDIEALDAVRVSARRTAERRLINIEKEAQLAAFDHDIELTRRERMLLEERQKLEAMKSPAPASPTPPTFRDHLAIALNEARDVSASIDEYIADIISQHGGSEHLLPDEPRRHIDTLRALKADKIAVLYEKLL